MSEYNVSFNSDGYLLSGVIREPDGLAPEDRRAAFLVLHGFGGHKDTPSVLTPCAMLEALGYVTLRFDMRGCGMSEGEPGHLICLEQVADVKNALTFLASEPQASQCHVDPKRIGIVGSSFGGAVAVYAGGVDQRIGAVISSSGWGNGENKFRLQHAQVGAYDKFLALLEQGRQHRASTGQSLMVPRYEIVPIPAHLRERIMPGSIQMFTAETAQSMFDFRAEDVIGAIAPRPCLLLHAAQDSVTPTQQSIDMFANAGQPSELHLFADADHFLFAENNARVRRIVSDWLADYFPAKS